MPPDHRPSEVSRRMFGTTVGAAALAAAGRAWARDDAPAIIVPDRARPAIPCGTAGGDVSARSGVVWARTDRPARMVVEWSTTGSFQDARRVVGPAALPEDDFTAQVVLPGLPPGQTISYRVTFRDLDSPRIVSHPASGSFRTPSDGPADVKLAWGGDVAGQGWGIDPARGGMRIFESIRREAPDVFLHSGDHIYADNPILAEVPLGDGSVWKNLVTEETSKVAETLAEFRGRYRYNLQDENLRRFLAEVPTLDQWDDHETLNNWYPGEILDDPRYAVKSVDLLSARARRAFFEYTPTRINSADRDRVYRTVRYGPLLEVFLLDQRSYRGPNSANRQPEAGDATAFLGAEQLRWLKRSLKASTATWKIIASDMPIGLILRDGPGTCEAIANGDGGPPSGRELELADLLRFLKAQSVRNVAWLTADVHYAAAHHYAPERAKFTDFAPFWEFVAGPLHAGNFGPNQLDATFGPKVQFCSLPPGTRANQPPSSGLQFFGMARIDARTRALTVSLHDAGGKSLYSVELPPEV
ncbi:alkaline phosphatase D family protein [Tundrisphaera sp. TA3]|uniref:alkaline phosphatase D family protein n=1 Tax=Tundrisphaera sp. TA3 TaxID=3435775 RepID=UPI003EBFB616